MAEDNDNDRDDLEPGAGESDSEQSETDARDAADAAREDQQVADGAAADLSPITGMMGIERWVQFAFIAFGFVLFGLADRLIGFVWDVVARTWGSVPQPDSTLISVIAAVVGIATALWLYRDQKINQFANEVAGELSKVTWPTRDETYYSTMVVIVTSVVAAVYTGAFDAAWSAFTDLIYNV